MSQPMSRPLGQPLDTDAPHQRPRRRPGVATVTRLAPPDRPVPTVSELQTALALEFDRSPGLPSRPRLALVVGRDPGLEGFATRFAQAVVEVISGDRGPQQLIRWTSPDVYHDLLARSQALHRVHPAGERGQRVRAVVRSVHLFRPDTGVAELAVHVRAGERSRALAIRLEEDEGQWRCTALEFG